MISYAQNQEDVVLSRLLPLVPVGTFIDVGAAHPIIHNVTYALYLDGWRGVNVEPMEREAQLLREQRPDDITMQVAVGAEPGTVTLYEAPLDNRGATTSDRAIADGYIAAGQTFTPFEVEVVTLDSILSTYPPGAVHVVKIDVEGWETEVLRGANLSVHQPWVLVIEATAPNTTEDRSSAWEPMVIAAGYTFTLFDGLNRFYVRNDLHEVQQLLGAPANVFDQWRTTAMVELEAEVARMNDRCRSELSAAASHVENVDQRFSDVEEYSRSLLAHIEQVEAKFSEVEEYCRSLEEHQQRYREVAREHELLSLTAREYAMGLEARAELSETYARSLEAQIERERRERDGA